MISPENIPLPPDDPVSPQSAHPLTSSTSGAAGTSPSSIFQHGSSTGNPSSGSQTPVQMDTDSNGNKNRDSTVPAACLACVSGPSCPTPSADAIRLAESTLH